MKAVVVHGPGDLRVEEVPDPVCGPDQVLVRVAWGGICGSDLGYARHGRTGTVVLSEPLVLGHEVSGTVVEVGTEVSGVQLGSEVALHPATLVGAGAPPLTDPASNRWTTVRYLGSAMFSPHEAGGFSELRAVRPDQLRVLPAGVDLRMAALAEPFAVALHAVSRAGDLSGRTVLVSGVGPIGALAVVAARIGGAAEVVATDLSAPMLALAARLGADRTILLDRSRTLPEVDLAIEASGAPGALSGLLTGIARGGTIVQVGNLPAEATVTLGQLVSREITLVGSFRFADEITDALDLMAAGVDLEPLITHEFDLDRAVEAFAVAADRAAGVGKVLLRL